MAQGLAQFETEVAVAQAGSSLPGDYGIIRRTEQPLVVPVKLPDQSLESISDYCIANLAAHGYSYSYGRNGRLGPEDDEAGGLDFAPVPGDPQKIGSSQEALMPGKSGHALVPYLEAMVTANLLRPLARLLLMTSLPFLVDMRTRNPWVLFRDVLLG